MAIVVIEGGRPNGGDLVLGEHLLNPRANGTSKPPQPVKYIPIGDDYALLAVGIKPMPTTDGELHSMLVASVGRVSVVAGIHDVVQIGLGVLNKFPIAEIKRLHAEALEPEKDPTETIA